MDKNPFKPFLERRGHAVLDGGLGTELESSGHDIGDALWSARLLHSDPAVIRAVHRSYFAAGADCTIGATYQASLEGFARLGLDTQQSARLLRASVAIARQARDEVCAEVAFGPDRPGPLVAASIGPYGAFLADGSEYRGNYGASNEDLRAFHRERWEILAQSGADVLACETLPCLQEAEVLLDLLAESPGTWAWFAFQCRDERHIADGTRLRDCIEVVAAHPSVAAVGVNCTGPRFVEPLLEEIRQCDAAVPVIVYPNSGECYNADDKTWHGDLDAVEFSEQALRWHAAGADIIGGCCRTGPAHTRAIREALDRAGGSG